MQGMSMLRCSLCFSTGKHLKLSYSVARRLQSNSVKDEETADIVISGGGMVGAAMACALAISSATMNHSCRATQVQTSIGLACFCATFGTHVVLLFSGRKDRYCFQYFGPQVLTLHKNLVPVSLDVDNMLVLGQEEVMKDKKIIMLEAAKQTEFKLSDKFGIRTCTVSPSSIDLFKSVGAWDEILQMRCHPVKRMQVWESCSDALITFNDENLVEDIAYVVENDIIQEALRRQLSKLSGRVEVRYSTSATSFIIPGVTPGYDNIDQNCWVTVNTTDDKTIKTKLLIGADGAQSPVRKAGEFHTVGWNYKQTAVVATLRLSEVTENNVAWQRFLPTGPIAMLPLSDQHSNLIWTTTPELAKHLKELPEDSFVDAVNDALWHERDMNSIAVGAGHRFQDLLSNFISSNNSIRQLPPTISGVEANSRASFPLALLHSSNYVLPRVALIGDAAHRIHPLAGQGINLGFCDVKELKDALVEAVSCGSDPGSLSHLTKYETSRQRKVIPVAATIDGLQKLYGTNFTPIVLLRTLGLQATNALSFVKDRIIQQASSP